MEPTSTYVKEGTISPIAATATPPDRGDGFFTLMLELIRVMLGHPWLLTLAVLPNIVKSALEPIQAWIAREVLDKITTGQETYRLTELLDYAPLAIGVFLGLGLLAIWEKMSNRMLDDRLFISLQRIWFERRHMADPGEQVARAINDCENARKPLDLFQKELWVVAVGLPSVLIWQLSLGPELLPALLVASMPPFLVALFFGGFISNASHQALIAMAAVGRAVGAGHRKDLHIEQERFYHHRIRFEMWKQFSEIIADFAGWLGLVVVIILSVTGIWQLVPDNVTAGQIGMFLVNLKLISKPFGEITKVYNKMCEGWPAVRRVLRPHLDA
jgi:ABC-type multidrug transport system fused ATPase/permease subunit